ncbi:MAG TPA: glycosyltransferase family 4 protein [Candidatus Paceibacterota bacterium]|nr:glycosyltransferase family 4 protein [Candidatus Paceibacterota bacterium]
MAASIITFADLGRKTSVAASSVAPVIATFIEKDALDRLICKTDRGYPFPRTYSALPLLLHYALRVEEVLRGERFSRRVWEKTFDRMAALRLGRSAVNVFHGGYFVPRALARSRARGAISIDLTRTVHPATNAALEREEAALLGVKDPAAFYFWAREPYAHANGFDYCIAISDFAKQSYVAAGYPEDRVYVAHPDIDLARFKPRARAPEEFRLLYVAYTAPLKGLHYLLDAWRSLNLPNAKLVLVGGYGEMAEEMKQRYDAAIAGDPSIEWVGNSASPEEQYKNASAFVFPSLSEGFGRALLEAMAAGLPVITTEHARGIVEDGVSGYIVPIRDSAALAEKIRALYEHPEDAWRMGEAARRAAHAKKPFGTAVYDIYCDIMKREGRL